MVKAAVKSLNEGTVLPTLGKMEELPQTDWLVGMPIGIFLLAN